MIDESAEMQLKQLLTKALDEAYAKGLESGKRTGFESGRRAGIEEAAKTCDAAAKLAFMGIVADMCAERIRALLEAKWHPND